MELDFGEITGMTRETDRRSQKPPFDNKMKIKKSNEFVERQVGKSVTKIKPNQFKHILTNLPDKGESSTTRLIKNDKVIDFPIEYYELSHFDESGKEIEESKGADIKNFVANAMNFHKEKLQSAVELVDDKEKNIYCKYSLNS